MRRTLDFPDDEDGPFKEELPPLERGLTPVRFGQGRGGVVQVPSPPSRVPSVVPSEPVT